MTIEKSWNVSTIHPAFYKFIENNSQTAYDMYYRASKNCTKKSYVESKEAISNASSGV